jgi:energy-coupling factor transport system ATP-binding protein
VISIRNLSFRYRGGGKDALSNINLEIPRGGFIGVIGSAGAGKSTLLSAINGVVPHHYPGDYYGSVRVNGIDSLEAKPEELSRIVGTVFQDIDGQMIAPVVEDEILFGLENFGFPPDEIQERLGESLAAAGISDLKDRSIGSLSGGQKQKVLIAAIIALKPRVLLLDEPTGELDPVSSRKVFQYLRELNEREEITIVVVEQKIMLLCAYAKHLAVMDRGGVLLAGSTGEVLQHPEILESAGVNVPRVCTLGRRLREEGFYDGPLPQDLDRAEKMIREILHAEL